MLFRELRDEQGHWRDKNVREVQRFRDFATVDWTDHHVVRPPKLTARARLLRSSQTWVLLTACGVLIGAIAALLNIITAWLASLRVGHCSGHFYLNREFCCWNEESCAAWRPWLHTPAGGYFAYVAWLAVFAATAAFLVKRYSPAAAGSGISEIKCIVSGFVVRGFLGASTLALKSICLPLAIGLGLLVGKEGPSVHYAVAAGNCVARLVPRFRVPVRGRDFLTAASAAGVAVAFGSPMGGVLFSMEEILLRHHLPTLWKAYVCALVGVATLAAFNPLRSGQLVLFEVTYDTRWHYFELPLYALLGAFGGIYGIVVCRFNKRVAGFRKRYLAQYPMREAVCLAVVLALLCYHNRFLRYDMTETMQTLFAECSADDALCEPNNSLRLVLALLVATVLRTALTIITYGCKVPAGIFVPSMAAGATFGRAVGILVERLHEKYPQLILFSACPSDGPCVIPGTYAFLGAGAALLGITHMTVTVVIIMFELTGAVRYIMPTMVAVAVTKWVNDTWGHGGIADQMILFNGLPYIDPKEEPLFDVTVAAAMAPETVVFETEKSYPLHELRRILSAAPFRGFPVVKSQENPSIVGYVARADLEDFLRGREDDAEPIHFGKGVGSDLAGLVNHAPIVVNVSTLLEYIRDIFIRVGPRHVLVEKDARLVGIVTRKDVLRYEHILHALAHPTVDDGWDQRVWNWFEAVGGVLRLGFSRIGLNAVAKWI